MNFKKHHVSKNLFGETLVSGYHLDITTGLPTTFGNNSRCAILSPFDVSNLNMVTFSFKSLTSSSKYFMYSLFNGTTLVERVAGKVSGDSIDVSSATHLYISVYSQIASEDILTSISDIMLNTGSTPLPYEPYSSEVWHDIPHYIHNTSTDTITTLPADVYADGNSATVGLKGQMVQSSTPSPTTPIQPSETGERTANLFDYKTVYSSYINANGDISTTANNLTSWNYFTEDDIGKTFTVSLYVDSISSSYIRVQGQIDSNYITGNAINAGSTGYTEITVTPTSTSDRWRITYGTGTPDVVLNQVMVAVSATRKVYEPFGIKIPILSANTTTNVYLGEVQSTRRIKKLVLTGEENFQEHSSISGLFTLTSITDYLFVNATTTLSTHYNSVSNYGSSYVPNGCLAFFWGSGRTERILYIHDDTYTSAADFKTFLQQQYANGTPVCVWYVLAEPTTGIVNEPIRKIGNYADTVSGITIPTITGKDTFDVRTTLKPPEVSLSYTGWHDATVKEWDGSEWQ